MGDQAKTLTAPGSISFTWAGDDTLLAGIPMGGKLLHYVMNSKASSACDREFSFATDKGTVRTWALQTSLFATPSNRAWVAVPQVGTRTESSRMHVVRHARW